MKKSTFILLNIILFAFSAAFVADVRAQTKIATAKTADSPAAKTPRGVRADMEFERTDFMREYFYKRIDNIGKDSSPAGAFSAPNIEWEKNGKQGKWYIEQQRHGAYAVLGGVAMKKRDVVERGLRLLRWGFAQQQADGSWNCPDAPHSASLFLTAAARAVLHLENSDYAKEYAADIASMKASLLKAAKWMVSPEIYAQRETGKTPRTHRFYVLASAIGQIGALNNDKDLLEKAKSYACEGLALQHPTGYNPENGGWDSSYNAAGLNFAVYYYLNAADAPMRAELYEMLRKSFAWNLSRINENGVVSVKGNTRVGANSKEVSRTNVPKKVNIGETTRALAYWTFISGDKQYVNRPEKVWTAKQPEFNSSDAKPAGK